MNPLHASAEPSHDDPGESRSAEILTVIKELCKIKASKRHEFLAPVINAEYRFARGRGSPPRLPLIITLVDLHITATKLVQNGERISNRTMRDDLKRSFIPCPNKLLADFVRAAKVAYTQKESRVTRIDNSRLNQIDKDPKASAPLSAEPQGIDVARDAKAFIEKTRNDAILFAVCNSLLCIAIGVMCGIIITAKFFCIPGASIHPN
jgi:hypothetical protein